MAIVPIAMATARKYNVQWDDFGVEFQNTNLANFLVSIGKNKKLSYLHDQYSAIICMFSTKTLPSINKQAFCTHKNPNYLSKWPFVKHLSHKS